MMRFVPLLLVVAATGGFAWLAAAQAPGWWLAASVFAAFSLTGVYDAVQTRHSLRRNYPLVARARWWAEELRPFLREYFLEDEHDGLPFEREKRELVYRRAKDIESVEPFGSEVDFRARDYEWIQHSIAACEPTHDGLRTPVGGPDCAHPYEASLLNISAMSFGSLGARAVEALNLGANMGGFAHDTGEGGVSSHHLKHGGDLIWEIGSGYFGCRNRDGSFNAEMFAETASDARVKMVEIKLSQGAKPGHGGVLPGAKVTAEIAGARGVDIGEDCISPPRHAAFSTPVELMEFVSRLREKSGGKPVGMKFCVGHPWEVFALVKAMRQTGVAPDYIVVDGAEGGTGAAPTEFINHVGMPLRDGLILVRNALVGADLKKHVALAAGGKVVSGFSFAMCLAHGADWCNSARGFMFALGCVQSMHCHKNTCPTGIATQDTSRQRGLVVEDKARRVASFHRNTLAALAHVAAAAGVAHPRELEPRHFSRRAEPDHAISHAELYPWLETGELLEDAAATPYAQAWAAARAGSFGAAG